MTPFELLAALQKDGWEISPVPIQARRRRAMAEPGAVPFNCETLLPKVLYPAQKGLPHRHYLLALLKAEDLFKAGVNHILHGKPPNYYSELLGTAGFELTKKTKRKRVELFEIDDGGGNMHDGSIGRMGVEASDRDLASLPSDIEKEFLDISSDEFGGGGARQLTQNSKVSFWDIR